MNSAYEYCLYMVMNDRKKRNTYDLICDSGLPYETVRTILKRAIEKGTVRRLLPKQSKLQKYELTGKGIGLIRDAQTVAMQRVGAAPWPCIRDEDCLYFEDCLAFASRTNIPAFECGRCKLRLRRL